LDNFNTVILYFTKIYINLSDFFVRPTSKKNQAPKESDDAKIILCAKPIPWE
jgi:hypothetical protein